MHDFISDPIEELKAVSKKILKLKILITSSRKGEVRSGLEKEVAKLEAYKEKIHMTFDIDDQVSPEDDEQANYEEPVEPDAPFMAKIRQDRRLGSTVSPAFKTDAVNLFYYLGGFEHHFLGFLSERRLRLDFQYSLERDTFYHQFQILMRKFEDFRVECERIEKENMQKGKTDPLDVKRRMKMQNILFMEVAKFFRQIRDFCDILIKDMKADQVICLNLDDPVELEVFEDASLLENMSVKKAVFQLQDYCLEVLDYLNMPDF